MSSPLARKLLARSERDTRRDDAAKRGAAATRITPQDLYFQRSALGLGALRTLTRTATPNEKENTDAPL